jgi:hypothetical protein
MSRFSNRDDHNFTTVTGLDGKPTRILKDGGRVRISMTMRDSLSPLQRAVAASTGSRQHAKPSFTDGYSIVDPAAGLKPGYRMPTTQDRSRVHDANDKADRQMRNQYKCGDQESVCPDCDGDGYIDGEQCDRCGGDGTVPEAGDKSRFGSRNEGGDPDPASDAQTMDRLYRERDAELSEMWRRS